jgi:hypothetical protein
METDRTYLVLFAVCEDEKESGDDEVAQKCPKDRTQPELCVKAECAVSEDLAELKRGWKSASSRQERSQ